jgi:FKBP-type peptidyl-prolyl cis-trans isomerase FklB
MKSIRYISLLGIALVFIACSGKTVKKSDLKTLKDSVSYAIGFDIGKNFKANEIDVNPDILLKALKEAFASDSSKIMNDAERQAVLMKLQQSVMEKQQEKMNKDAEKNEAAGKAFLEKIKSEPGVKEIAPGLYCKMLKAGSGRVPNDSSEVTTNYIGKLIDGSEFDNSYKRGQPATFPVNGIMKGWQLALKNMREGDKCILYIYSDLAYGRRAMGEQIPAGSTLIFEMELLSVK